MLNKKRVLGKGLGALIAGAPPPNPPLSRGGVGGGEGTEGSYFSCRTEEIRPNTLQPRKRFEDGSLKELSDSIKEKGVILPLLVRRGSSGYELIAGERRLRAAKMAGLKEVPVVVADATDEQSLELAVIENIQREDLNAIEEAEAYRSLGNFGLSQDEVAKRVGKERSTVANYLRLLKLPQEIKDELVKGSISMGHARAILSVQGHGQETELCRKIIAKGLSVREAERLASAKGAATKTRQAKGSVYAFIESELRGIFGTKVSVKEKKNKGTIELHYYSAEERERLIEILMSRGK